MPFASKAQRAYLFSQQPSLAEEFAKATPKGKKLPERLHPAFKQAKSTHAKLHGRKK